MPIEVKASVDSSKLCERNTPMKRSATTRSTPRLKQKDESYLTIDPAKQQHERRNSRKPVGLFRSIIEASPKYSKSVLSSSQSSLKNSKSATRSYTRTASPVYKKQKLSCHRYYSTHSNYDNESVSSEYTTADESIGGSLLSLESK